MLADYLDLFSYNRWAHERTISAIGWLTIEDLRRPIGGSFASVYATMAHLYGAEYSWLARWLGTPAGAVRDLEGIADVPGLRACWEQLWPRQLDFLTGLWEADLQRQIAIRTRAGVESVQPLAATLTHVVNHATYHRGQVATLLRQLGAEPIATDLFLYYHETRGGAPRSGGPLAKESGP